MRAIGVIRRIDDLGRIIIPKEVRRQIYGSSEAAEGQPMEFFIGNDNSIILKPYHSETEWDVIRTASGKIAKVVCECGYSGKSASNYCPNCGKRKSLPPK